MGSGYVRDESTVRGRPDITKRDVRQLRAVEVPMRLREEERMRYSQRVDLWVAAVELSRVLYSLGLVSWEQADVISEEIWSFICRLE